MFWQRTSATARSTPLNDGVWTRSASTSLATASAWIGICDLTTGAAGFDASTIFTVVGAHGYVA